MTKTSVRGLVLVTLLALVAVTAFLYVTSYGRRLRHQGVRVARLARNASGIYPVPSLRFKTRGEGRGPLLVEVYESGRVVVTGRGDRFDRELPRATVAEILVAGKAAIEELDGTGCGTTRGRITSEVDLLLDGSWVGRACVDTAGLPQSPASKQLLEQLATNVPGLSGRF
jgi:hypothetical protein